MSLRMQIENTLVGYRRRDRRAEAVVVVAEG
jgi:hypothetical protein